MTKTFLTALSLAFCLFAAGCTDSDWNRMLNFGGGAEEEAPVQPVAQATAEAAATAAPAAAAEPSNTQFCRDIAAQDATRNGFDQATQQRVFQRSFQQCLAIYTR